MSSKEKQQENNEELNENVSEKEEAKKNSLEEKVKELELKYADSCDKYLRVLAEYDNFRKRTLKERDTIYSEAYADAVTNLLPVIDNIERITSLECEKSFLEGLNLIVSGIHQTLEKMGVKEIETKTFDPNLHNAVMHIDDENLGEGEIVEVFQKGYIYGDRVIRYAMVKVAN